MAFTQFASNLGVEVKGKDSGAIGATMITMITVKTMIKIITKITMITKTKSEIFSRLEVTDKRWQVSRRPLGLSLRPLKLMRRGTCLM